MDIFWLIIFSVIGGVFGGMGMGGGTLLIPLLTIFLGFNQQVAQGFNLVTFLIMSVFALILHAKNHLVDFKIALKIVLPALIFSAGGAFLANVINGEVLRVCFGTFLVLLSLFEIYKIA